MLGRVLVAVAVCLALPAPALAQDVQKTTFGRAAAQVDYPLFQPTRTLGLKAHVTSVLNGCVKGANPREILARFGKPSGHGPQLGLYQARPYYCGDPGESRPYRTVRVLHRKVTISAYCESAEPECKLFKGRTHGFVLVMRLRTGKQHRLTGIGLESSNISFRQFVRVARSLRRVKPDLSPNPPVHLAGFLSHDGKIWCGIDADDGSRWCTTDWPNQYGAHVSADGNVVLCGLGQPAANSECANNWDTYAPHLQDGQSSDFGGYVCTDEGAAVTCTVKAGPGAGKGFRVHASGSEVIDPAP
jgi:hypothetical protein